MVCCQKRQNRNATSCVPTSGIMSADWYDNEGGWDLSGLRVLTRRVRSGSGTEREERQIFKDGVRMPDDYDVSGFAVVPGSKKQYTNYFIPVSVTSGSLTAVLGVVSALVSVSKSSKGD